MMFTKPISNAALLFMCAGFALVISCGGDKPKPSTAQSADEPEPDIFSGEVDFAGGTGDACNLYEQAANAIWSYDVQSNLDLAVKIYEGRLEASDAELLVGNMEAFKKKWLELFKALCDNREQEGLLAKGQYKDAVVCLDAVLKSQREYLLEIARTDHIDGDSAAALVEDIDQCTDIAEPAGPKAMKNNPF